MIFLILILAISATLAQFDATTADYFPALSLKNPAFFDKGAKWQIDFYRPYAGIGDLIYTGGLSGQYCLDKSAISLNFEYLNSDMYYKTFIAPGFGMRAKNLFVGIAPELIFDGWKTDAFHYEGDEGNDPYFDEGGSEIGITGNLGAYYNTGFASIGLLCENLLPSSLSPNDVERSAIEADINLSAQRELFSGIVKVGFGYDVSAPSKKNINGAIGYSRKIGKVLGVNTAFDWRSMLWDVGISMNITPDIAIGYAFEYPFTKISDVATSHRIAIGGTIEPKIVKPNITIKILPEHYKTIADREIEFMIVVENYYSALDKPAQILVLAGKDTLIKETVMLKRNDSKHYVKKFKALSNVNLSAIADFGNAINEENESDNTAQAQIEIIPKPSAEISINPTELKLTSISYTYQDRSVVPTIFFGKDDSKIYNRFDFLLKLIAQRISTNPDVELEITGFIAPDEMNVSLAKQRADAVMSAFNALSLEIEEQMKVIITDDPGKIRVPQFGLKTGDTTLLMDENRRVELFVKMDNKIETEVKNGDVPSLDWNTINGILHTNEDVVLVIAADNKTGDEQKALSEAFRLKRYIVEKIGDAMSNKILASIARMEKAKDASRIFLSSDGVLYKPFVISASREITPNVLPQADIKMITQGDIVRWKVDALDYNERNILSLITEGKGFPPDSMKWDFRSEDKDILPIGRKVSLRFIVSDSFGQADTSFTKEPIKTIVEEEEVREEKLLLVQFEFDKPAAQSRYLEDRLELVARRLVDMISSSKKTTIEIDGHTDIIGLKGRNRELSQQRADAVQKLLKYAMTEVIQIKISEFDSWLKQHNAQITAIGLSETEPFEIEVWHEGMPANILIGDNTLPEGRTVNRRVMVVVTTEQ